VEEWIAALAVIPESQGDAVIIVACPSEIG
jgi:hypothetical protein